MTYRGQGEDELSLWNEEDGMYYDAIQWDNGDSTQLPVRSLVGLIPLYATLVLEPSTVSRFPGFKKRMEWFLDNRPEMSMRNMANMKGGWLSLVHRYSCSRFAVRIARGRGERKLLALASKERLIKILEKMLDEDEFFSEHGIRSSVRSVSYYESSTEAIASQTIEEAQGSTLGHGRQGGTVRSGLLAWRFQVRDVWWQLQLAWTYL